MGRPNDRRAVDGFTPRNRARPVRGGFDPTARTRTPWLLRDRRRLPEREVPE